MTASKSRPWTLPLLLLPALALAAPDPSARRQLEAAAGGDAADVMDGSISRGALPAAGGRLALVSADEGLRHGGAARPSLAPYRPSEERYTADNPAPGSFMDRYSRRQKAEGRYPLIGLGIGLGLGLLAGIVAAFWLPAAPAFLIGWGVSAVAGVSGALAGRELARKRYPVFSDE